MDPLRKGFGDASMKTFSYNDDGPNGRKFSTLTRVWHGRQVMDDGAQTLSLELATSVEDERPVYVVFSRSPVMYYVGMAILCVGF